jgi:hypothetical protein
LLSVIAITKCSDPQDLSLADHTITFATMDGRFSWDVPESLSVAQLNSTPTDHIRFQWTHLPDQFGAASIGGALETGWNTNNNSRVVIGCSIQAGWVPASIMTDEYSSWTGWYPWNIQWGARTPSWSEPASGQSGQRRTAESQWLMSGLTFSPLRFRIRSLPAALGHLRQSRLLSKSAGLMMACTMRTMLLQPTPGSGMEVRHQSECLPRGYNQQRHCRWTEPQWVVSCLRKHRPHERVATCVIRSG